MYTPTVLVLTSDRPIGRVIKRFTGGPATHVAIGLGAGVLHAQGSGVVFEPRQALAEQGYALLGEYAIRPDVTPGLVHTLRQLGKGYDVADLVGWPLRALGRKRTRLDGARSRWTCVRLALALDPDRSRIPEWAGLDAATVTPTLLWHTLHGASFVRIA